MSEMASGVRDVRFELESELLGRTVLCDLSDDFTLPDYMPEIGRVITVGASVAPPSRYIGRGEAEYAGAIRYRMLYEGAENGELSCAELPSEYDARLQPEAGDTLPADAGGLGGYATASAENVSARVTAPRRVTVRSRVRLRACLTGKREYECTGLRGTDPSDVRLLEGTASAGATAFGSSEPVECHETIPPEENGGGEGEIRVVSCRGEVFTTETAPSAGGAVCSGEIILYLLLCRDGEGERPYRLIRHIPVTAEIPFNTALPEGASPVGYRSWGNCTAASASVEDGKVLCEATAVFNAEGTAEYDFNYVRDVYSCSRNCECAFRELAVSTPAGCCNGNVTVSGSETLEALQMDSGMKILDITGSIPADSVTTGEADGRVVLNGHIVATVLTDDGASVTSRNMNVPFRYVTPIQAARNTDMTVNPVLNVTGCRARVDGDRLAADCELQAAVYAAQTRRLRTVSEIRLGEARRGTQRCEARITVCYPSRDDTLWSVAKRYGADPKRIAEENNVSSDGEPDSPASLSGIKFLVV